MQSADRCLKSSSQLFLATRHVHEGTFRRFQPPDFKFSNWGETTGATALSGHVWIPNPQKLWKMVNDCCCLNCRVEFCDVAIEKKLYAALLEVADASLHDAALKAPSCQSPGQLLISQPCLGSCGSRRHLLRPGCDFHSALTLEKISDIYF